MHINNVTRNLSKSRQALTRQQNLIGSMLSKQYAVQSKKRDIFIKSTACDTGVYTFPAEKNSKMISNSLLTIMNNDISQLQKQGNVYECGGIRFTADQIPKIKENMLSEIKARDNIIDFKKEKYFRYISSDGKSHCLYTDKKGIGAIVSEIIRGEAHDAVLEKYASFWNYMMQKDPIYIGLTYSDTQIREYMKEAGIEIGFFTVKMGDRETTQFYSATEMTSPIQSVERYDSLYQSLTSDGILLNEYEPESIFKIGAWEYPLSDSHTLDIPYGKDIFSLEYPNGYKFGIKVEV